MSVQSGRWTFDGQPADHEFTRRAARLTTKYCPEGETTCLDKPLAMSFQPFQTTEQSRQENQPLVSSAGPVLTWDGRLDNRDELVCLLDLGGNPPHTDAGIVLAAYEQWNTGCFRTLLGDWALAIWDPRVPALFLARDFVGARQLFYTLESSRITWSTVLDPLVLLSGRPLQVSEEFIAGYLSTLPGTHQTPYVGISSVPPGTFVQIERRRALTREYWGFDPAHRIRYRTDRDYEEHFRYAFKEAVRRRLRASSPVLAELSGGMDSTSIVCMADALLAEGQAETPRLDTISYYDDDEPNWNERPYFSLIEQRRGREGYHIDVSGTEGAFLSPGEDFFFPMPGYDLLGLTRTREFHRCLEASQSRVLLSGIGGDEFLGGVPAALPELQDLFASLHCVRFLRQLFRFSMQQRRPWLHLWLDTIEEFLPQPVRRLYKHVRVPPWLTREFVHRHADVFWADSQRTALFGARPSLQSGVSTLHHMRRQLNCSHLEAPARYRVTYPYLDRDLLVFLFAIPREQLLRPGQRRSLMRRALAHLLPAEICNRKRKAFIARRPIQLIDTALPNIERLLEASFAAARAWLDLSVITAQLESARHGHPEYLIPLLGTLKLELWLQSAARQGVIDATPRQVPLDRNGREQKLPGTLFHSTTFAAAMPVRSAPTNDRGIS
jgi:asparagine synthase (glutamine-hydrolysing)